MRSAAIKLQLVIGAVLLGQLSFARDGVTVLRPGVTNMLGSDVRLIASAVDGTNLSEVILYNGRERTVRASRAEISENSGGILRLNLLNAQIMKTEPGGKTTTLYHADVQPFVVDESYRFRASSHSATPVPVRKEKFQYIAKSDDTLQTVADSWGCSIEELKQLNPQLPASGPIPKGSIINFAVTIPER